MNETRRMLLIGAGVLASGGRAGAQPAAAAGESFPIWPGPPPGAPPQWRAEPPVTVAKTMVRKVSEPRLTVYRPARPDGSGVVVLPGGGYGMLSVVGEGAKVAEALNPAGTTVFVLTYRLPGEGWAAPADTPLQDAQRALRLVRARAVEFGVDPERTGVLGFSAGGHLASTLATRHGEVVYRAQDAADSLSARPTFAGLVYPVIAMDADKAERGSRRNLLGATPSQATIAARSSERLVDAQTSPCFLVHGLDDKLVPVENSLMMLEALRRHGIKCEAHLFQQGAHGFGVGLPGQGNAEWPRLFLAWLKRLGVRP